MVLTLILMAPEFGLFVAARQWRFDTPGAARCWGGARGNRPIPRQDMTDLLQPCDKAKFIAF
jgi:hypothetical protein